MVVKNSLSCGGHTSEVTVSNCSVSTLDESLLDGVGSGVTEDGGVTRVDLQHLCACLFHLHSLEIERSSYVGVDRFEFF